MRTTILALSAGLSLASCFVSEGDCVTNGVVVEPCLVSAKAGQTIVLRAAVVGAPSEPINWFLPPSAESAFSKVATDNELTLVSLQNVPGSYAIQASSRTDPLTYGGSVVGVGSASFSSQPPPFVVFGGDFPGGNTYGATAVGGNLYYVAYANTAPSLAAPPGSSLLPPPSTNFFVKQYGLATNALLADIPGQFLQFTSPSGPIVPNIAADCAGNGYWIDVASSGLPNYVLRKLGPGSTTATERSLGAFSQFAFQAFAVGCDGAIYFVARPVGFNAAELFLLTSFDGVLTRVRTLPDFLAPVVDALAVDVNGRLLAGDRNPDGSPAIFRLVVDRLAPGGPVATLDTSFASVGDLSGATALASDAAGVVYGALDNGDGTSRIAAFNELGAEIYSIDTYAYFCPGTCANPLCDTQIPFTQILSLGASPGGALRAFDGPDTSTLPAECQEALRFVLIDPQ